MGRWLSAHRRDKWRNGKVGSQALLLLLGDLSCMQIPQRLECDAFIALTSTAEL